MNRKPWIRSASIALSFLLAAGPAWPWGAEGHRVVALIAAKNISAGTRAKLAAILGTSDSGLDAAMATAATWPDDGLDKKKTGTADWHFVDVPITSPFAIGTLCDQHNCVIDQIEDMKDRLQNNKSGFQMQAPPTKPRPMTSQEVAFLIHFVGDIHQPLHSANDGDRGGNCVKLIHIIKHKPFDTDNLHSAWDDDEVRAVFAKLGDEQAVAAALFQSFKSGAAVPQLMTLDWAHESNDLARKDIYTSLNLPNHTGVAPGQCAPKIAKIDVTSTYLNGNETDVETQLMRAGIRLSNALDQICAGSGCQVVPDPGTNGKKKKKKEK